MTLKLFTQSCLAFWNPPVVLWSGFRKPFTEHTRLTETRRCKSSWSKQTSVSRNINSRTAFGKPAELESVFLEVVLKLKFEYLVSYEVKKCKNHKLSYRKYWFNFLNTKIESNIWWDCTFKSDAGLCGYRIRCPECLCVSVGFCFVTGHCIRNTSHFRSATEPWCSYTDRRITVHHNTVQISSDNKYVLKRIIF